MAFFLIIFWIMLYGVSIVIALAAAEERYRSKITWESILPYFIGNLPVLFGIFYHGNNHGLLDTILFVLFSLILTWILIFVGKKK